EFIQFLLCQLFIIEIHMAETAGIDVGEVAIRSRELDMRVLFGDAFFGNEPCSRHAEVTEQVASVIQPEIQFTGTDGNLAYVDPRRFGHMYLYDEAQAQAKLDELGCDLLDAAFTPHYFKSTLLRYPERAVKVSLLDQSLFAGTGNYIANEICAHGGVLPHRKVKTLTSREFTRLYAGVAKVLDPTIGRGGTAFGGGYRDANGETGNGVEHLVVFYQQTCQLCKNIPVIKTILAQRGTYHCPKCQK
ncbi:MAG: hypothetical protein AAF571_15345, partial [Verrucomicrobiota bacterium]